MDKHGSPRPARPQVLLFSEGRGEAAIGRAVSTLKRLRKRVDANRTGEPARLVVITAGGYGYEHPEGVTVVPITALGP